MDVCDILRPAVASFGELALDDLRRKSGDQVDTEEGKVREAASERKNGYSHSKHQLSSFVSTRYAQLAQRVLQNILFIAGLCVLCPLVLQSLRLYYGNQPIPGVAKHDFVVFGAQHTQLQKLVRTISHESAHLPFLCIVAGSLGPGKMLYIFVSTLVVAFVFLPPNFNFNLNFNRNRDIIDDDDNDKDFTSNKTSNSNSNSRCVINLTTQSHSWGIFPLLRIKSLQQWGDHDTPIFCNEIACWLCEASWQSYYSANNFSIDEYSPGKMNLASIGLRLEREVIDKMTDTFSFICSNVKEIVSGESGHKGGKCAVDRAKWLQIYILARLHPLLS